MTPPKGPGSPIELPASAIVPATASITTCLENAADAQRRSRLARERGNQNGTLFWNSMEQAWLNTAEMIEAVGRVRSTFTDMGAIAPF